MKLVTFFEKFDQFADAPDAVVKMRELVLELAVRGRLLSSGNPDPSAPFPIPHDWQWIALNEAADCRAAAKVDSASLNDTDWVLDLEDIDGGVGKVIATATFAERRSLSTKASFQKGDVLYGKLRPYLNKVVIADRPGFCTTEIIPLRPQKFVAAGYLRLFLRSPHFLRYAAAKNYGMKMPRLGTQDLESAEIPLPPLAEQKRIVEKVDELMALCDRLEAQQQERETRHAALARASLARFADAPTPANLHFLFHPSYAIPPADLRKSILTLAVQGKLVPQDPKDEPAEDLLKRSHAERKKLKRTDGQEGQPLSAEDALGYDIPESWRWQRLDDLLVFGPTNGFSPKAVEYETPVRSLTLSATTSGRFKGQHSKFITTEVPADSDLWLRDGDILVQRGNTIEYVGVAAVYRGEPNCFVYPDLMMKLRVSSAFDVEYIHLAMSHEASRDFLRARASGTSGSMPKINQTTLKSLPLPIPPLAEQRRIVAKVEQLMALVDALETQLATSRATAANLLTALVAELTGTASRLPEHP